MADEHGTRSLKYKTVQKFFDRLVNVMKPAVASVARRAFSKALITKENMTAASNPMFGEEYRATVVMGHILDRIEDDEAAFDALMAILQDIPAVREHLPKEMVSHYSEDAVVPLGVGCAPNVGSNGTGKTSSNGDTRTSNPDITNGIIHPFQCTCGECRLKAYIAGRCPKTGCTPYPYLDMERLDKSSRVDLIAKLESELEDIGLKFANLICTTRTSLNDQKVRPKDLAISVLSLRAMESKAFHKPLLMKHEEKIMNAESVSDILLTLMPYISFFNYGALQHIINDLGSDDDKGNMEGYLDSFQEFCKRNVFRVPPNVYGQASSTMKVCLL